MNLTLRGAWIKALTKNGFDRPEFQDHLRYSDDERWVKIDAERFTSDELVFLYDYAQGLIQKSKDGKVEGAAGLRQKIAVFQKLRANPTGVKVGRLDSLQVALKTYIEPSAHQWIFYADEDEMPVPYFVHKIVYKPAGDRGEAASTTIYASASLRGKGIQHNIQFTSDELNKTVVELLSSRGAYLETPEMVKDYFEQIETYKNVSPRTGCQFNASGTAFSKEYRWSSALMAMIRDGVPSKVVMDDVFREGGGDDKETVISSAFWSKDATKAKHRHGLIEDEDERTVMLPVHPYVQVFDLGRHEYCVIHVNFLEPYAYDAELIHKLVLPDAKKQLLAIMVQGSNVLMEDIVKGKTGGIIVVCTGPPGTGKTLTAEVFSEEIQRPLYAVQCSQLGTDEETLEKALELILGRSVRWGAILLIDEADVYVHERGDDIQQNAIVGVFLRILEHYRGVLFLTSNRSTIIDDAIMSRATAWIKYDYPSKQEAFEIWSVLSENYGIKLHPTAINELVEHFQKVSGRSIKSMLRLSKLLAMSRKETVTTETVKYVSQFLALEAGPKA